MFGRGGERGGGRVFWGVFWGEGDVFWGLCFGGGGRCFGRGCFGEGGCFGGCFGEGAGEVLWGVAIDTTLVSTLHCDGSARLVLLDCVALLSSQTQEGAHLSRVDWTTRSGQIGVFAAEVGGRWGRWSEETRSFLCHLVGQGQSTV